MHRPLVAAPFRILRIFHMADLTVGIKILQRDSLQRLRIGIVQPRIDQSLNLSFFNILQDDMFLRLHAVVPLYLIVQDIAVSRIGPWHNILVKRDRTETHDQSHDNGRCRDPSEADAAGLHGCDLA